MGEHETVLQQLHEVVVGQPLEAVGRPDLITMAGRLGISVHYVSTDDSLDAFGWSGARGKHVVVNRAISAEQQEKALAREMAWVLRGHNVND